MSISQFKATTADLLTSIKSRGMIPDSQSTYSDDQLLALADEELQTGLLPLVLSTREEYYTTSIDYAPNGTSYQIPYRAIGLKLRNVVLVNGTNSESRVPRIDPQNRENNMVFAFYLLQDQVVFTSPPINTVRLYFHLRPSTLIQTTNAARITSVNASSLDVSSVPSTITSGTSVDFIRASPSFKCLATDITVGTVAGTNLPFTATIPSTLAIGDYVAPAGQSPIVQLPYELIPVLAQRVCIKVLEGLGDAQGVGVADAKLKEMEHAAFKLLEPRVDGDLEKVVNYQSQLRRSRRVYFGSR